MKKPKMYLVTYKTDALSLPTILQTMEGTASLVAIREAPADAAPAAPDARLPRQQPNGHRRVMINGMDGAALLRQILGTAGGRTIEQITTAFVDTGYAGNSAKARVSEAVRAGSVVRAGDKFYLKSSVAGA